ncbi:rCG27351 [Rattus norvegicus]|uniref:RCG27351 n=1 Tax=Rattus norvegicus TaxID=10116 RepID=A6HPL0_RAT|nr:rCG27351 [Rattus norvegicus]
MSPLYSCLGGSMAPSVQNWKRHSPQSWRLQCFGKVPSWQAGTGQGCSGSASKIQFHFVMAW